MDLTPELVADRADEYRDRQPLWAVEVEHREILPTMFEAGEFGWRDPEWVVQWFFRRLLGAYPDEARRRVEAAYGENTYEAVATAIAEATEASDTAEKLAHLTTLSGVDVPVASAFLQYMAPERYLVVSEREWSLLRAAGALEVPYPDTVDAAAYGTYLAACEAVASRCDCSLWTLYRALWVLGAEREEDAGR